MHIIGHGIDLVEIDRIAAMLREHGDRFRRRCFTSQEQEYADSASVRRPERYAARFAAKEAVLKALATGWRSGIAWTDVGVINAPSGAPRLVLTGRSAAVAEELGVRRWHLSLSHSGGYAMASAIAWGGEGLSVDG